MSWADEIGFVTAISCSVNPSIAVMIPVIADSEPWSGDMLFTVTVVSLLS